MIFLDDWHPNADQLAAWIDNDLGERETVLVETHLQECQECMATVACATEQAVRLAHTRQRLLDTALRLRRGRH